MVERQEEVEMLASRHGDQVIPSANFYDAHDCDGYRPDEQNNSLQAFGVDDSPQSTQDSVDSCQHHCDERTGPEFGAQQSLEYDGPGINGHRDLGEHIGHQRYQR